MTALNLILTQAGMARFTAAQMGEPIDLTVAAVGLTAQDFYPAPTLTALPGEFRRVAGVSGEIVGNNIAHIVMRDDAAIGYTVRGFGLFLADGTLLAAYGQPTPIVEKSPAVTLLMPLDLAFPTSAIDRLTFGNANFLNPPATEETAGVIEIATLAEAETSDTRRAVTGSIVKTMITKAIDAFRGTLDAAIAATIEAMDGLAARTTYGAGLVKGGGRNDTNLTLTVDAASAAEIRAGIALDLAVTPAGLAAAQMLYVVESGPGFRLLSDGSHEQWGTAPVPGSEGPFSLQFPRAFANECTGVFTALINNAGSTNGQTTIQERALYPERADLFVQNHQTSNNDASGFRWRAYGR